MLKHLRSGAKSTVLKIILFGLLMLAMAGLALMDVQGMFRKGVSSGVIVKFKNGQITAPEFNRTVQDILRQQKIKPSDAYRAGIPYQILKNEIDKRLLAMEAYNIGLKIGNDVAAQQIKEIIAPLTAKGASDKEALDHILRTYNLSEPQLVASIKEQLSIQKLLATVVSSAYVPQQLIEDSINYNNEWRRAEYFAINTDDIKEIVAPEEEALRSYYETIANQYALPEYRTLSVLILDKDALGDGAKTSEENVKKYYEENLDSFSTIGSVEIEQIVVNDQATADNLYSIALNGGLLKEIAEKYKANYIKPETFTEDNIMKELTESVFTGKTGDVLLPIKSPLGWHVVYINAIKTSTADPFDKVKGEIETLLSHESSVEALYELSNKVEDGLAGGKTLADAAKEINVPLKTLEAVDSYGFNKEKYQPYSGLPIYNKILETGFGLEKNSVSQLLETPDATAFIIVSADNIIPPENQPFERIRSKIITRWMAGEQLKALAIKSAEVMENIKSGKTFEQAAKELKKEITSTQLIKRGASKTESGSNPRVIKTLFSLNQIGDISPVSSDGSVKIIKFAERTVKTPKDAEEEKQQQALKQRLEEALKMDLLEQYRIKLMEEYDVSINHKLMDEIFNPENEELLNEEG